MSDRDQSPLAERAKWLKSLEIGSSCVTLHHDAWSGRRSYRVRIVVRLTKTQIICRVADGSQETRYRRADGKGIDRKTNRSSIDPYTTQIKKEMRHEGLVTAVADACYSFRHMAQCQTLSDELLERMLDALREAQTEIKSKASKEP